MEPREPMPIAMATLSSANLPNGQSLAELRAARIMLRQELSFANHWHRLVRARIDLSVAVAAKPGTLGGVVSEYVDSTRVPMPQEIRELADVVLHGEGLTPIDLPQLRALDYSLNEYERSIRTELMRVTDLIVGASS